MGRLKAERCCAKPTKRPFGSRLNLSLADKTADLRDYLKGAAALTDQEDLLIPEGSRRSQVALFKAEMEILVRLVDSQS